MNRRQVVGAIASSLPLLAAGEVNARTGRTATPRPVAAQDGMTRSKDGLALSYTRYGKGPPIIVCYGAFTVAADWASFAKALGQQFTVYLYDRRGHARSPDAGFAYTLDSELDDIAAMVKLAGPGAAILGHSFGGGCALAYALRDGFAGKLVLYEPVHSIMRPIGGENLPILQDLVAQGDLEVAAEFAMVNIVRAPKEAVAAFRTLPIWPQMRDQVRAFPNEVRLLDSLQWKASDLQKLKAAVWMLLGSETVRHSAAAIDNGLVSTIAALIDRIPGTTLCPVSGQGHTAYLENPELLATVVARCLSSS